MSCAGVETVNEQQIHLEVIFWKILLLTLKEAGLRELF